MDTNSTTNTMGEFIEIHESSVPKIDEKFHDFYKRIIKSNLDSLQFEDNLTIFSYTGHEIGRFTIKVKEELFNNQECFHVMAKSDGTLDDIPSGTDIDAYIGKNLETLQQSHREYIKNKAHPLERTLVIKKEGDDYIIEQKILDVNGTKENKYKISSALMVDFISEGANLLLQRVMVQKSLVEYLCLFTFDSGVKPSLVKYKPLDRRTIKIKDETYDIVGIERTIESSNDVPTSWQMYFSNDGHIVNRVQVGSPFVIKATEKLEAVELDEYLPLPVIPKKELDWENDMEMHSKYLDRKEELKNEYNQYLKDHQDLKLLLSDYMQTILSHKPEDVIEFSAKFFAPYSSKTATNRLFPALDSPINIPKNS